MRSQCEHDQYRGSEDSQESQRPIRVRESSASMGAGKLMKREHDANHALAQAAELKRARAERASLLALGESTK